MIAINNIKKHFGEHVALDVEALQIQAGTIFGLVGNNGAGKTTLFRILLDLIQADSGTIETFGINPSNSEEWKFFTGSFIDETFLIGFLTPEEYLGFVANLRGLSKEDLDLEFARFEGFFNDEIIGKKKYIRDLSKGNQKKVGIVSAMIGKPKVIVLDEPFANLDPSSQFKLRQLIKAELQGGESIALISSHDLNHVAELCDRIAILNKGQLVKDMPSNENTYADLQAFFQVE